MIVRFLTLFFSTGGLSIILLSIWAIWTDSINESYPNHLEYIIVTEENVTSKPFEPHTLSEKDLHTLIDLQPFNFNMNHLICDNNTQLIIALIHSAPNNFEKRDAIRSTWAKMIPTLFFLGVSDSNVTQDKIIEENQIYNDIIQGNFLDSYRNLTYKHVMVLKWTLYYCPSVRYLLKTDDDAFVNAPYLLEILNYKLSPLGARNLLMCELVMYTMVKRSYRSKWRVSYAEYPDRWYPAYCKGWAIIYSPDVIYKLYKEAQATPYFWIDDVHITGTVAMKQNITVTDFGKLVVQESDVTDVKFFEHNFVFCLLNQAEKSMKKLWAKILHHDYVNVSSSTIP